MTPSRLRQTSKVVGFATAIAFVATACSSEADKPALTASGVPPSQTTTTSAPISTTTTGQPTSATGQPTTTVDQAVEVRAAVEAAFAEQFDVWRDCTADYDSCDPAVVFADVYTGRAVDNLTEAVTSRQGTGRKNTPLTPDPDFQRVDGIEFTTDDLTAATVFYCAVDSRLVSVSDESGVDVVFDDGVFHEEGLAFYEIAEDGIWRLARFDVLLKSAEEPICDE